MSYHVLSPTDWAQRHFGSVDLKDRRLNRRAVRVAEAMVANPSGSLPEQHEQWKDLKAAYRMFDHPQVGFESISECHWQQTRLEAACYPVVLMIQDTTWLSYGSHPATTGLGRHGAGEHQGDHGLLLHSVLAVAPHEPDEHNEHNEQDDDSDNNGSTRIDGAVLGLAHARLWARNGQVICKDQAARSKRRKSPDREGLRWIDAVDQVGDPSDSGANACTCRWLHVGDRESDIYDLYEKSLEKANVGFVIRLKHNRSAVADHDSPEVMNLKDRKGSLLKDLARAMPALGQMTLAIRARPDRAARTAVLSVAAAPVTLYSPAVKGRNAKALRCWCVRVWEPNPPVDVEPIEWILLTSEPVNGLEDAIRIAGYYSLRWLIEQFHQCLKSGCKVEERQLETMDRLAPLIGMLSVMAVRLLQMKNDARLTPDKPASACVPTEMIRTLCRLQGLSSTNMTIRQFVHAVAKKGGFLGRRGDGEPGWKTLWRGWLKLTLIHQGYLLAKEEERYG